MISLRTHNVIDYVIGAVLVLSPFIFGFSDVAAARNIFLLLGFGLVAYSLITNYYYSVAKIIPVKTHMIMDVAVGLILMVSPYLFSYRDAITGGQMAWHIIMGLGAWTLVAVTERKMNRIAPSNIDHLRDRFERAA